MKMHTQKSSDPFNWPMPSRDDLMSLNTISLDKDHFRVKTAIASKRTRLFSQNLDTCDIQGAKPKPYIREVINRPEFQNQNWDIDRSCPRALHIQLNKPEYNLTNSDIEKSKPNYIKFQTTRPPSNPLNPQYKLAEVEYRVPTPPKFIRDQISNADIEGAKTKKAKYFETREIMGISDIQGTHPKKVYVRGTQYDSFNYFDITKTKFASSRSVNPLMPCYTVKDEHNNFVEIGDIQGNSPKKLPQQRTQGNFFQQLEVRDIPGTAPGSKRMGNFHSRDRKDFGETNNIMEVAGAQADTLKKGVQTKRSTNPLNPVYTVPGSSEQTNTASNNPYGRPEGSSYDNKYVQIQKKLELQKAQQKDQTLKDVVQRPIDFKKDMAKFYDVNPALTKNVDLQMVMVRKGQENDNKVNNESTFFGNNAIKGGSGSQTTKNETNNVRFSEVKELNRGGEVFVEERLDMQKQQQRASTAQNNTRVHPQSTIFKKNAAAFYGTKLDQCELSSQGSIFQKNAANFYGMENPAIGERPFKIEKPSKEQVEGSKGFSVLNEQRLKQHEINMQRDPKFVNNKDKFYGMNKNDMMMAGKVASQSSQQSLAKSKLSHAQKLDNFISNK